MSLKETRFLGWAADWQGIGRGLAGDGGKKTGFLVCIPQITAMSGKETRFLGGLFNFEITVVKAKALTTNLTPRQ
jgi:hypothetical protein